MDAGRIEKIQKLMALANDERAPEAERESAREKAFTLMTLWQIDDATVASHGQKTDEKIVVREVFLPTIRTYSPEYAALVARVAEVFGARGFVKTTRWADAAKKTTLRGTQTIGLIVGYESDLDTIQLLAMSLLVQCEMGVATAVHKHSYWDILSATEKYNFKRSFIAGFRVEVTDRIAAVRKTTVSESKTTGAELVLVNREDKIDKYVADSMQIGKGHQRSYRAGGFNAGTTAGQTANIGQTAFATKRKEIGG